jgi:hypothetical protein
VIGTWLGVVLVAQYAVLATVSACEYKWAAVLYWLSAIGVTVAVVWMSAHTEISK